MDYDFYSTNWFEIELLHSEHLHAETLYVEQLQRWGLQHGRSWGVVSIGPDDLVVSGGEINYSVLLHQCKAITPRGYIVDINRYNAPLRLQNSNDRHTGTFVPLYLGVRMTKEYVNAGSSQTGALLDRPALCWSHRLAVEPNSSDHDWLQIGSLRKYGQNFVRDENYIPLCVHLRSYPALYRIASEITLAAEQALNALQEAFVVRGSGQAAPDDWKALMGVMVTALAPAAALIDTYLHPREYLQKLATVLRAYSTLLRLLPQEDSRWRDANDLVQEALKALGLNGQAGGLNPFEGTVSPGASAPLEMMTLPAGYGSDVLPAEERRSGAGWWEVFDIIKRALQKLAQLFTGMKPTTTRPTETSLDNSGGTRMEPAGPRPAQPVKKW